MEEDPAIKSHFDAASYHESAAFHHRQAAHHLRYLGFEHRDAATKHSEHASEDSAMARELSMSAVSLTNKGMEKAIQAAPNHRAAGGSAVAIESLSSHQAAFPYCAEPLPR